MLARTKNVNLKLFVVALALLLAITLAAGGVTFSRFYDDFENKGNVRVAQPVAKITSSAVYRTDKDGNRETIDIDSNSSLITVKDVEPEDVIDYYFSITDTSGTLHNEVYLKVDLSVGVKLEMLQQGGAKTTEYFKGWHTYGDEDGIKSGGRLEIYRVSGGESQIQPNASGSTEIDYTGYTLFIDENAEDGSIANKTGLYITPNEGTAKVYSYHVRFVLPKQNEETQKYVGAKLYMDIDMLAEQIESR